MEKYIIYSKEGKEIFVDCVKCKDRLRELRSIVRFMTLYVYKNGKLFYTNKYDNVKKITYQIYA